MEEEKCPVCKLDLHPAMASRYSGCCSQGCEAIAKVGRLESENEALHKEIDALKMKLSMNKHPISITHDREAQAEAERFMGEIAEYRELLRKYCDESGGMTNGETMIFPIDVWNKRISKIKAKLQSGDGEGK